MHCPQCGTSAVEEASVCIACGAALPREPVRPVSAPDPPFASGRSARTIVGVASETMVGGTPRELNRFAAPPSAAAVAAASMGGPGPPQTPRETSHHEDASARAPQLAPPAANRTIVGMMVPASVSALPAAPSPAGFGSAQRTMLGVVAPIADPAPARAPLAGSGPPAARTMLGVAVPGIAPLHPGDPGFEPPLATGFRPEGPSPGESTRASSELGATVAPIGPSWAPMLDASFSTKARFSRPRSPDRNREARPKLASPSVSPRRALLIVGAGGAMALGAVLIAVLWPSAPPLTVRARADAEGHEGVEIGCSTCPDGTTITVGPTAVLMQKHLAQVPLATPLTVGENPIKVAIDRPGNGRDETVGVVVPLGYRIRPDLATLQGERPAIQIVVEAPQGTRVTLGGRPVALAAGRAVETVDVTDAVTGLADEVTLLNRQVPYSVTPKEGAPEQGIVNVSVSVVPLHLDAPGPTAVIDGKTFVLAGRSLKGAEVQAAGRPIQVKADGTFAQVMNVSSVGATQIEVRARMANMAPRLTRIDVRRVESLETAAREFTAKSPLGYADIASNPAAAAGKLVLLGGEVVDARRQNHQTVMLLDVAAAFGCRPRGSGSEACHVRLVLGSESDAKPGDTLRAYGRVVRAYGVAGRRDIPEVGVDFTLKGLR